MQKDNNNFAQDLEILNDFLTNVSVNFPCPHISSFCLAQRFNVVNFPHFCFLFFCLLDPVMSERVCCRSSCSRSVVTGIKGQRAEHQTRVFRFVTCFYCSKKLNQLFAVDLVLLLNLSRYVISGTKSDLMFFF